MNFIYLFSCKSISKYFRGGETHTHTHTHTYIYIYIVVELGIYVRGDKIKRQDWKKKLI